MAKVQKLLFVDTNIWLDFYRARGDAAVSLLEHLESISAKIIVSYQLEMEFKKNRHEAIREGEQQLKSPDHISRPAFFSDAQAVKGIQKSIDEARKQVGILRNKYPRVLSDPAAHDPVYKAVQRIFHKNDDLVWKKENPAFRKIYKLAFDRFLQGCPPRKKNDTSMGDALNWEWMIYCAIKKNAELVIVSRDSDYGFTHEKKTYLNDHLRQEFSERVSKKRKILVTTKLTEALRHFNVAVSRTEREEEAKLLREINKQEQEAASVSKESVTKLFEDLSRAFQTLNPGSTKSGEYETNELANLEKQSPKAPVSEDPQKSIVPPAPKGEENGTDDKEE